MMMWRALLQRVLRTIGIFFMWRFTSQGVRLMVSEVIIGQLVAGPVTNMIQNLNSTQQLIHCNLKIVNKLIHQRKAFEMGPFQKFMQQIENGVALEKKAVLGLRRMMDPFDVSDEKTDEDKYLEDLAKAAKIMATRQRGIEHAEEGTSPAANITDHHWQAWEKFNSSLAKATAQRYYSRCSEAFSRTLQVCNRQAVALQDKCYQTVPILLKLFACRPINPLNLCKPEEIEAKTAKFCDVGNLVERRMSSNMSNFDATMENLTQVHDRIEQELRVNIHYHLIEVPSFLHHISFEESRINIEVTMHYSKVIFKLMSLCRSTISLIFMLELAWRAWNHSKNCVFRLPSLSDIHQEIRTALGDWKVLEKRLIYFILILVISLIFLLDWVYYEFICALRDYSGIRIQHGGAQNVSIRAVGEGPLTPLISELLSLEYSQKVGHTIDNRHCIEQFQPSPPNFLLCAFLIGVVVFIIFAKFVVDPIVNLVIGKEADEHQENPEPNNRKSV